MKPIDFILFDGDSSPNTEVYKIAEAIQKTLRIHSADKNWEILSYFFDGESMVIDIIEEGEEE